MRVQTECNLTVRLTWESTDNRPHPEHTFGCVQDEEMAITMASYASQSAPMARRLTGLEVSPSGGRHDPWKPLDLPDIVSA
jgi:hypothetical protein